MQRRAGNQLSASAAPQITTTIGGNRGSHFPSRRPKKRKLNLVQVLLLAAISLLGISYYLFPSEVERDLDIIATNVYKAEHKLEDLILPGEVDAGHDGKKHKDPTARMLAQSSKWVDGEKKLKKKLKELEQLQQKGQYLGVPVLTRFLGDDFPAWVGEDVNEEEWKRNVEAEYVKMRKEEEEWKEQMQKIIDQRERDIGITTAR